MLFLMLAAVLFALLIGTLAFVTGPVGLAMAAAIALWLLLYAARSILRASSRRRAATRSAADASHGAVDVSVRRPAPRSVKRQSAAAPAERRSTTAPTKRRQATAPAGRQSVAASAERQSAAAPAERQSSAALAERQSAERKVSEAVHHV